MTGSWKEKTEKEVEILPFPCQGAILVLASTGLAQESPFNDPVFQQIILLFHRYSGNL